MDAGCYAEKVDYNILTGTSSTLLALHQVKIGVQLLVLEGKSGSSPAGYR